MEEKEEENDRGTMWLITVSGTGRGERIPSDFISIISGERQTGIPITYLGGINRKERPKKPIKTWDRMGLRRGWGKRPCRIIYVPGVVRSPIKCGFFHGCPTPPGSLRARPSVTIGSTRNPTATPSVLLTSVELLGYSKKKKKKLNPWRGKRFELDNKSLQNPSSRGKRLSGMKRRFFLCFFMSTTR